MGICMLLWKKQKYDQRGKFVLKLVIGTGRQDVLMKVCKMSLHFKGSNYNVHVVSYYHIIKEIN